LEFWRFTCAQRGLHKRCCTQEGSKSKQIDY
jgi:hypothetical protein